MQLQYKPIKVWHSSFFYCISSTYYGKNPQSLKLQILYLNSGCSRIPANLLSISESLSKPCREERIFDQMLFTLAPSTGIHKVMPARSSACFPTLAPGRGACPPAPQPPLECCGTDRFPLATTQRHITTINVHCRERRQLGPWKQHEAM